jgi:NAD(P)-dependent dehydrogenase (short-subunit alcohol dehydrogenase family)/acyl carrier protein
VVLVGRSAPSDEARRAVDEIEAQGARVLVERADVSKEDECAALLARLRSQEFPLRGVIHAAGVLDDGVLVEQDWSRCARVLEPKVAGAWNLHRGLAGTRLDFFVCFSSAASILGSAGQGSYAAANAFLDALAHLRRGRGLPGLTVNWGPWAEVGMAARLTPRDRERLDAQGFRAITVAQGTSLLFDLIEAGQAQVVVLPVDWTRYVRFFGPGGIPRLVADVARAAAEASPDKAEEGKVTSLAQRLQQASPARRRGILMLAIQDLAVKVMGLAPTSAVDPDRPLREIGLDSLMAVELRNALAAGLGRSLPATLLFDHPSINAIADHLGPAPRTPDRGATFPDPNPPTSIDAGWRF